VIGKSTKPVNYPLSSQVVTRGNPLENLTLFCLAPLLICRAAVKSANEQPKPANVSGNVPVIVHIEILAKGNHNVNRHLPKY
jgi:hypothetical protein